MQNAPSPVETRFYLVPNYICATNNLLYLAVLVLYSVHISQKDAVQ